MRWTRQTITVVVIVFLSIAFASAVIKFATDNYGEPITIGGDAPSSTTPDQPDDDGVETGDVDDETGLRWVLEDDLPVFAQGTLALIDQGGPFPCDQDGSTFQNRERILPEEEPGYYAEYTVLEASSCEGRRGALRIVAGDGDGRDLFWTEDHYESFSRILRRDAS